MQQKSTFKALVLVSAIVLASACSKNEPAFSGRRAFTLRGFVSLVSLHPTHPVTARAVASFVPEFVSVSGQFPNKSGVEIGPIYFRLTNRLPFT